MFPIQLQPAEEERQGQSHWKDKTGHLSTALSTGERGNRSSIRPCKQGSRTKNHENGCRVHSHAGVERNHVRALDSIEVAKEGKHRSDQTTESKNLRCDDVVSSFPAKKEKGGAEHEKSKTGSQGHSAGRRYSNIGPSVSNQHFIYPEIETKTIFREGEQADTSHQQPTDLP